MSTRTQLAFVFFTPLRRSCPPPLPSAWPAHSSCEVTVAARQPAR